MSAKRTGSESEAVTRIADRKTISKGETSALYRGRPLVVVLQPHDILIREKGRRQAYAVPYLAIFETGMKLAAMESRKLKAERRRR